MTPNNRPGDRPRPAPRYPVNRDIPVYLWQQVADHLAGRIEAGEFTGRLPNQQKLADQYGVGVPTISHAIRILAERGLVVVVMRGKGTYLTRRPPRRCITRQRPSQHGEPP